MRLLLALLAATTAAAQTGSTPATPVHDLGWRAARWGMTVEEVLASFPGEARRLERDERLADGNVVSAGIEAYEVAGVPLRVRFVFAEGRLTLVSLRTPEAGSFTADDFARVTGALAAGFGWPGTSTRDDNLIDLRQTRWRLGRTAVDAKYIPGVVAVVWFPWPPPGEPAAR